MAATELPRHLEWRWPCSICGLPLTTPTLGSGGRRPEQHPAVIAALYSFGAPGVGRAPSGVATKLTGNIPLPAQDRTSRPNDVLDSKLQLSSSLSTVTGSSSADMVQPSAIIRTRSASDRAGRLVAQLAGRSLCAEPPAQCPQRALAKSISRRISGSSPHRVCCHPRSASILRMGWFSARTSATKVCTPLPRAISASRRSNAVPTPRR